MLSHRNLIVGAESVSTYLKNTSDDVILSVLPLSFDAGLSQVTTAFAVGAHCVLMNYLLPREVPEAVRAARRHRASRACPRCGCSSPTSPWPEEVAAAAALLGEHRRPDAARHSSIGFAASSPRADPYLMYGLTEAFRSTYLDPREVDRRPDSIGKAIPNAEILVLRPDGTRCAPGEEGELVHRGALVALGYWNDPERTAERYRPVHHPGQEWRAPELAVWSGDTVVADEEGFLYFVGRTDDMIKTSGYRVSPTRDRGGRVRHRAGAGCRRARGRGAGHRPADRARRDGRGRRPRRRGAARGAAAGAAAVHGAVADRRCATNCLARRTASSIAHLIKAEVSAMKPHEHVAAFGTVDGELRVGGHAAVAGSPPASARRRSSPTTAGCSTRASTACARRCPPGSSSATR